MFYVKNIPGWERVMRMLAGIMMVIAALVAFKGQMLGYGMVLIGGMMGMTGFIGFCPMCAMVGRKLKAKH